MRPIFLALLGCVVVAGNAFPGAAARAAELMSEQRALAKAVSILQGDPYGDTPQAVIAGIRERRFGAQRDSVCTGGNQPVWGFHVVIEHPQSDPDGKIDGWLVIDAYGGRIVCATLPFLD